MITFGLIYCAYNTEEYINQSIAPWTQVKLAYPVIPTVVSVPFIGFEQERIDKTEEMLKKIPFAYSFIDNTPITEHEARNKCLHYLLEQKCDYIIILDSDEFYSVDEINNLLHLCQKDPFIAWYSVEFKNYTFSEDTYTEGFRPPRVFKTETFTHKMSSFFWDNDISYTRKSKGENVSYTKLAHAEIPKAVCHPKHLTWLDNERSKQKVEYQMRHFGHCSFKYIDKLEFNEQFYKNNNQEIPKLIQG